MKYIVEDIMSVERIEDFKDEYVYDIEVDDDSHTFVANGILVHNSVYTSYEPFFACWTPEALATVPTDRAKCEWILKFNTEFLDAQNTQWVKELYEPRHGHSVHKFELENINVTHCVLSKKKYVKAIGFYKGRFYDTPKISGTGVELIKSTTPPFCRGLLKDIVSSIMFDMKGMEKEEFELLLNEKLSAYKQDFYNAQWEEISQSVGVGDYKKFVIDDTNSLKLEKGCPVSVQAVARFNYMAHQKGDDSKKFYSGKIKHYCIRTGPKADNIGYFGFQSGELPSWAPRPDFQTQWTKNVVDPINRFLEAVGIHKADETGMIQDTLF